MNSSKYLLSLAFTLAWAGTPALGAAFIRNPSFESNFNDTWPHYSSADEWTGISGVNDLELDPTGPFHNSGTPVPDRTRVGFKQGGGDVTQDISGLIAGETYWLQLFYDGRQGGGSAEELIVKWNDTEIGRDANLRPSTGSYYFMSAPFTAEADTGTIRFTHIVSGDRTLLLDGITVVARATNDIVLRNPSFEASGILPAVGAVATIAGWVQTGTAGVDDGTAGFANNGTVPDQDLVAFIEGEGSLSQTLDGLIIGNEYELKLGVNAKTGTAPKLQIKVGDTIIAEPDIAPGAYQVLSFKFTAAATEAELSLAQTKAGSDALLLDNVRLLGVIKKPLPPMAFSPLASEVSPGETITYTLHIPAEAVTTTGVDIRLGTSSAAVGRLVGAADDGSLTVRFDPNVTSRTFSVESVNRGTASINVLESAKIPVTGTPTLNVVSSFVKNASFESGPAPASPGYGDILGWQRSGNTGVNRTDGPANPAGPFGDNGLVPDREQVGFIQGAGSLSQQINGLTVGRSYWLQYRYNARNCCNERSQKLTVRFGGKLVAEYAEVKPVADLGEVNYYSATVPFIAEATSGLLEFVHEVTGDGSVVLDAVSIVPRAADEIVIQNPSFESSGSPAGVGYTQPFQLAGWDSNIGRGINVDGEGPFSDNGDVPDQDRTGFIQGIGGFLSQSIPGLTAGQKYTLIYSINGRNCCGGSIPTTRVSWNDATVLEEEIPPIGGRNPFAAKYVPFTADSTEGVLKFEITGPAGGDVSLLVDDVHVVPGERTPPIIAEQPAGQSVNAGDAITLNVKATGSGLLYQWRRNGMALVNGGRIAGATSDRLTITSSTVPDAGDYSVLVLDGLGMFASEAAVVEVQGTLPAPALQVIQGSAEVQIRWSTEAVGYRLQRSTALGAAWTDALEPVVVEGSANVVRVATGTSPEFFRLTN